MFHSLDSESHIAVRAGNHPRSQYSIGVGDSDNSNSSEEEDLFDIFVTQKCRNDVVTVNEFFLRSADYEDDHSASPTGIRRSKVQKQVHYISDILMKVELMH